MPHRLQGNQETPILTILIKTSKPETILGKPLIRRSLPLLIISTEDTLNGFNVIDVTLLNVDLPVAIAVKP